MMGTLLVRSAGLLLAYAMTVALTRALGSADFGHLATGLSLAAIFSTCASFGLPMLVTRDIARSGNKAENASLIVKSFAIVICLSVLAAAALSVLGFLLAPAARPALLVALLIFPAMALIQVRQGAGNPLSGSASALFPEQTALPVLAIAGLWSASHFGAVSLQTASLIYAAASLTALAGGMTAIIAYVRFNGGSLPPKDMGVAAASALLRSAAPFFLAQLPRTLSANLDVLIIAYALGPASAGIYAVAARLANLIALPLFAAAMAYMPLFAADHQQNDFERASKTARVAAFYSFAGACGTAALLAFAHGPLTRLFGADFSALPPILLALSVGQLFNSGCGPNGAILLMTGHEKSAAALAWLQSALLCVLTLAFAASGSLLMAACGAALSVAAGNFASSVLLWRKTGMIVHPFLSLSELRGELGALLGKSR
jgi:O-antigen/teichoic acid export membrane protein